jgi:nucleotide-binding universal stress UspA family protein
MLPIQTILHPTDFSKQAECAFQLARSLARDHKARLVVLHVLARPEAVPYDELPLIPPPPPDFEGAYAKLKEWAPLEPRLTVEHLVEVGYAESVILSTAEDLKADLIVMGTHGRTGLGRLLLGSVAEQVLRRATCPVLTVKAPYHAAPTEAEPRELATAK